MAKVGKILVMVVALIVGAVFWTAVLPQPWCLVACFFTGLPIGYFGATWLSN